MIAASDVQQGVQPRAAGKGVTWSAARSREEVWGLQQQAAGLGRSDGL